MREPTKDPDKGAAFKVPLSEVGSDGKPSEMIGARSSSSSTPQSNLLTNMEALLSRLLATPQAPVTTVSTPQTTQLIQFDPDDADADIEGWCRVTDIIVSSKKLDGIELLMALTKALKGRAANCLTKLKLDQITWSHVKETLMAKFCKPKLMQDYFDDVLRFQIGVKETACDAAARLWDFIERIPNTNLSEEVIVGFVISVLCHKDNLIRRELNANVIKDRPQLFRVLRGVSLKRRSEAGEGYDSEVKRTRVNDTKFTGRCHWCGMTGHKQIECRMRQDNSKRLQSETSDFTRITERRPATTVTCYKCKKAGHTSNNCPDKKVETAVKEVNTCSHRVSRGSLETSTGLGRLQDFEFSLTPLLTCCGFFIMYLVEELVHMYIHHRERSNGKAQLLVRNLSIRRSKRSADSDEINGVKSVTNSTADLVDSDYNKEKDAEHNHAHHHSHMPVDVGDDVTSALRGLLIVLALSIHELFEGLAVGLESSTNNVWYMLGAVSAHKLVIAFCIGVELIASRTKTWLAVIYITTFAVVSPFGIGIGMILVGGGGAVAAGVYSVVLQGLASGTLLYVIFFEIWRGDRTGITQYFAAIIGFGLMFGLQLLTPHAHSHSDDDDCHGHSHDHGHGHSHNH